MPDIKKSPDLCKDVTSQIVHSILPTHQQPSPGVLMQQRDTRRSFCSPVRHCVKTAGLKQHHQSRAGDGGRSHHRRMRQGASTCRVPHLPFLQHLLTAHSSSDILQLCRMCFPKPSQPILETASKGACHQLFIEMGQLGEEIWLEIVFFLLGLKLPACKQLFPGSCWVQLDESGCSREEEVKADKITCAIQCHVLPTQQFRDPMGLQKYLSNPSFI